MSIEIDVFEQEGKQFLRYPLKYKGNWFVSINDTYYLHKDLTIRIGTRNKDGERIGIFETKEEAIKAIEDYYSKPEL